MTETTKTLSFVAAGVLAVAAAYFVDYGAQTEDVQQLVGKTLNDDVDVGEPRRLQIIKFDRDTASVRQFEVAEVDGVWSLPSKQDYPADATEQMAAAATSVINRKILRIAGETAQSHAEFGVIDPLSGKLDVKSTGVGTRVIMTDADDQELVDMIIGKAVKDAPGQRYVRNSRQDVVYVVEIDPSKLSTDFEDWIEDDLLELNALGLRRLFINDYSADLSIGMTSQGRIVPQVTRDRRHELALAHPEDDSNWEVVSIKKFASQEVGMVDEALAEGEEVNQDAVRELINGLDDLLIVDVAKKPAGLSADLKAGEDFLTNNEAFEDLAGKGFIPVGGESGADILSSEGEVVSTLSDGVEYVLRFGQLQVQTDSAAGGEEADAEAAAAKAADPAKDGDKEADADADGENLRRYLFVMARFNEGAVARPELKELPPLPEENAESEEAPADAAAAENAETGATDAAAVDAEGEEAADDQPADEADASEEESDEAANKPDAEAIMAERKEIEQENQRLMDEYQSTLESGQKKVADLNERFGDWYFVISNDVYKKIHLGRDQVIKKKEQPAAEGGEAGATSGLPELPGGIPGGAAAGADAAAGDTEATAEEQP